MAKIVQNRLAISAAEGEAGVRAEGDPAQLVRRGISIRRGRVQPGSFLKNAHIFPSARL